MGYWWSWALPSAYSDADFMAKKIKAALVDAPPAGKPNEVRHQRCGQLAPVAADSVLAVALGGYYTILLSNYHAADASGSAAPDARSLASREVTVELITCGGAAGWKRPT